MANCYCSGLRALALGTIQWATSDMRCILCDSGYTFADTHDYLTDGSPSIATSEISQGGRATLDGEAVTLDDANHGCYLDATDETYTALAAGETPSQVIIYLYNAADASAQVLCRNALTTPPAPNGGDYTLVWSATGIMTLYNA